MSHHLPPADQPDNYGGNHRGSQIRWVAIEPGTTTATGHLIPHHTHENDPTTTSYCTRYNPAWLIDLHGLAYTSRYGTRIVDTRVGLPDLQDMTRLRCHGVPIVWCKHCLTMLAVEAEMNGQRAYPVKSLIAAMRKAKTSH